MDTHITDKHIDNRHIDDQKKTSDIIRGYISISFAIVFLWQLFLLCNIIGNTPAIEKWMENLGMELPFITQLYISLNIWYPILPIITLLVIIDIIRRKQIPKLYSIIAFGAAVLITLLVQMISMQALYAPMFKVMGKV